jgi:ABC-type uncharacterized transport system ATPase subunit
MYTSEFENVARRHGHGGGVDNVPFIVQPGRVTGLLGPGSAGCQPR